MEHQDVDLKNVSTRDLVEELKKREGVETCDISLEESYSLEVDHNGYYDTYVDEGPAIILIVTD